MRLVTGAVLFLALALPWFVAVAAANDEFLRFFFYQEHFQRFTSHFHHRQKEPWYFIPLLAFGIAPFLLALPPAWLQGVRKKTWSVPVFAVDAKLLLALWALVVFAFFSFSGSKLPAYIAPMFPALALLIGAWLAESRPRRLLIAQGALLALVGAGLALLAPRYTGAYPGFAPWLVAAGVCIAAAALGAAAAAWRGKLAAAVILLALAGFAPAQLALVGHGTQAGIYSAAGVIGAVQPPIPREARVYAVDAYDHSIPWYLRRTVTMVEYRDELGVAVDWEPDKFVADLTGFARAWREEGAAYAFLAARDFERLRGELPMQVLARDRRYVIVRKP